MTASTTPGPGSAAAAWTFQSRDRRAPASTAAPCDGLPAALDVDGPDMDWDLLFRCVLERLAALAADLPPPPSALSWPQDQGGVLRECLVALERLRLSVPGAWVPPAGWVCPGAPRFTAAVAPGLRSALTGAAAPT